MDRHFNTLKIRFHFIPLTVLMCLQIVAFFHKNLVARTTLSPSTINLPTDSIWTRLPTHFVYSRFQQKLQKCIMVSCLRSLLQAASLPLSSLVFYDIDNFLKSCFIECPSISVWYFLMVRLSLSFWQKSHVGDILPSPVYPIQGYMMSAYLIPGHVKLDRWLRWCLPGFSTRKLLLFPL